MGRITFTADEHHEDIISDVEAETDVESTSAAVRECITRYADLQQREEDLQQRVEELQQSVDELEPKAARVDDLEEENQRLRDRVEELEAELEQQEARADDLRRQLKAANSKNEQMQQLARYVEEERRVEQRWREASLLTRAKWKITGMPAEG